MPNIKYYGSLFALASLVGSSPLPGLKKMINNARQFAGQQVNSVTSMVTGKTIIPPPTANGQTIDPNAETSYNVALGLEDHESVAPVVDNQNQPVLTSVNPFENAITKGAHYHYGLNIPQQPPIPSPDLSQLGAALAIAANAVRNMTGPGSTAQSYKISATPYQAKAVLEFMRKALDENRTVAAPPYPQYTPVPPPFTLLPPLLSRPEQMFLLQNFIDSIPVTPNGLSRLDLTGDPTTDIAHLDQVVKNLDGFLKGVIDNVKKNKYKGGGAAANSASGSAGTPAASSGGDDASG